MQQQQQQQQQPQQYTMYQQDVQSSGYQEGGYYNVASTQDSYSQAQQSVAYDYNQQQAQHGQLYSQAAVYQ